MDKACSCRNLSSAVCDPNYWDQGFSFPGVDKYPAHFQIPEGELLDPPLTYERHLYVCKACGQHWYINCAPEEQPEPLFAMKYEEGAEPAPDEILRQTQLLCVLVHDGHDVGECRYAGCENKRLKGRELCELHCSIL